MDAKMKLIASLKIWLVIYPSLMGFQYFIGSYLSVLPLYVRTFLLTIALVPWVMFIGVPFINFLIRQIVKNEKI
jgi:antibiotic biosynthesis monooxygenase (ABM) superfamily enzyme